jgi:RNA polymerase sigma factor (sigma-70 family)
MDDRVMQKATELQRLFMDLRPELLKRARALGAAGEAEDVLQDIWVRLATLPIEASSNPRAYLTRMVYTAVLDRHRASRRAMNREQQWAKLGNDAVHVVGGNEAERSLEARQELQRLAATLRALGDPVASLFWRHRVDGVPQRQLAQEFGMGLSTVEKHLRRAYAAVLNARRALED